MLGYSGLPDPDPGFLPGVGIQRRTSLLVHQRYDVSRKSPRELAPEDENMPEMQSLYPIHGANTLHFPSLN